MTDQADLPAISPFANVQMSGRIDELTKAMAAVQKAVEDPERNAKNPHFKSLYVNLPAVLNATRDLLAENGLAVIQIPVAGDGQAGVVSILSHKSGQWIAGRTCFEIAKQDPQAAGSAITYARRYSIQGMTATSYEIDDDGNHASGRGDATPVQQHQRPPEEQRPSLQPSKEYMAEIGEKIKQYRQQDDWQRAFPSIEAVRHWVNTTHPQGFPGWEEVVMSTNRLVLQALHGDLLNELARRCQRNSQGVA